MEEYQCSVCGEFHSELPLAFGAAAPHAYAELSDADAKVRADLSTDLCVIDEELFFIRGQLEIPIVGEDQLFTWGVWLSISRDSFARALEVWEQEGREHEPPYFGWLNTSLKIYPNTLGLKARIHTRPKGLRPFVELEPTEHPLAIEQREGITWDRVYTIAAAVLHSD
jgi:hypothetical protein